MSKSPFRNWPQFYPLIPNFNPYLAHQRHIQQFELVDVDQHTKMHHVQHLCHLQLLHEFLLKKKKTISIVENCVILHRLFSSCLSLCCLIKLNIYYLRVLDNVLLHIGNCMDLGCRALLLYQQYVIRRQVLSQLL